MQNKFHDLLSKIIYDNKYEVKSVKNIKIHNRNKKGV